jgi:predicted AAA+ superfamily ATPase
MHRRWMMGPLVEALADRPVVLLNGARQAGKTTLVRQIAGEAHPSRYLTLDDAAVLSAADADPAGFVAGLDGPVILDEVQRAPGLFLAIKAAVDRDRRPGRFLLTGSADVLLLPRLADALVGRVEILTLWPLSQGEIEGRTDAFVDAVFADRLQGLPPPHRPDAALAARIVRGGFPEVADRDEARRAAWFGAYVTTILQRDVRDLAHVEGLTALPRLLKLLAARTMSVLNYADLARNAGIAQSTLKRYMALLEATYLVRTIPAWFANIGKRLAKAPKVLLGDTGLAAHLQGLDAPRLVEDRGLLGPLLENFVVMELTKQLGWSRNRARLHYFRTHAGGEVDIVLEDPRGRLVGVEVKAASGVGAGAFQGLRELAEATGKRFLRGIVLYTGTEVVPFGPRLHAVPVRALWSWASTSA